MTITAEQRERRKNHIGASDVPAILGLNPWRSAYDVFLEKTQSMSQAESDAMDIGNRLEPVVLDWAEEQLGPLIRNVELVSKELPFMAANLDAAVIETKYPVEAKTGGLLNKLDDKWGEPLTDQVPDYVATQAYAQMYVSESGVCFVPAFLGGRGFNLYQVNRDDETMRIIVEKCSEFWENRVLKNIPPDNSDPHLEVVKRIHRQIGPVVSVPDELVKAWKVAKEAEKVAKETAEAAQAKVIAALGSGESGTCSEGVVSYNLQSRAAYSVAALTYRVLRLSKPKTPKK